MLLCLSQTHVQLSHSTSREERICKTHKNSWSCFSGHFFLFLVPSSSLTGEGGKGRGRVGRRRPVAETFSGHHTTAHDIPLLPGPSTRKLEKNAQLHHALLSLFSPAVTLAPPLQLYGRGVQHDADRGTKGLCGEGSSKLCANNTRVAVWPGDLAPDNPDLGSPLLGLSLVHVRDLLAQVEAKLRRSASDQRTAISL